MPNKEHVCDFCCDPEPIWKYSANSNTALNVMGVPFQVSGLEWLACDVCSSMVETDDKPGLMARAMVTMERLHPAPPFTDQQSIRLHNKMIVEGVHNVFWTYRLPGRSYIGEVVDIDK